MKKLKLKEEAVREAKHRGNVRRGRNSKKKGAGYERTIAKKLGEAFGIELKRTPQSGGFAKSNERADDFRGDITVIDKLYDFLLHVECKDCKTWSLPSWLRQAESDCPDGKTPIVVFHQHGTSNDYVCLRLEDFLSMADSNIFIKKRIGGSR